MTFHPPLAEYRSGRERGVQTATCETTASRWLLSRVTKAAGLDVPGKGA